MKSHLVNLIFYKPQTQYGNLGDLIINKTLLMKLREYGSLIVDERGVPDWYFKELKITDDERASQYKLKFNYLILIFALKKLFNFNSGNVYLVMSPGHKYGQIKLNQLISHLQTVVHLLIFRLIGIRICSFGVSIGPFSQGLKMVEQCKSKLMYFYSVRDSLSEDYAHEIGIAKTERFPDLAWLMQKPKFSNLPVNMEGDYVIFSFRDYTYGVSQSNSLNEISEYKNKLFIRLDKIVDLVCGELSKKLVITYQVSSDHDFCQVLKDRYKDLYNVAFIERQLDSQSMSALYSRASIVFSNRLHVLIFAMICGSLPIAVVDTANHNKITGIFLDIGLMQLVIDILQEPFEVEILRKISADSPLIKEKIALYYESIQKFSEIVLSRVMDGTSDEYLPSVIRQNTPD